MKKLLVLLSLFVIVLFLVSCTPTEEVSTGDVEEAALAGQAVAGNKCIINKETKQVTYTYYHQKLKKYVAQSVPQFKCLDESQLQENYCKGKNHLTKKTSCSAGAVCKDGACITKEIIEESKVNCVDSDNGLDFFTKGTVISSEYPEGIEDYGYTYTTTDKIYLHEGTCADNKYKAISKNCAELGKYEYKDGACVCTPNCAGKTCGEDDCGGSCGGCIKGYYCENNICKKKCETYTGLGTYTVSICDKISYNNVTFEIKDMHIQKLNNSMIKVENGIPTNPLEEYKILKGNVFGKITYFTPGKESSQTPTSNGLHLKYTLDRFAGPFLTELGLNLYLHNLSLVNPNLPLYDPLILGATISVYPDCKPLLELCENIIDETPELPTPAVGNPCHSLCYYTTNEPTKDYAIKENIIISMPKGYTIALGLAAEHAQTCYNLIKELYGIELEYPVYINYWEKDKPLGKTGCNFGNYFGKVLCHITPAFSDENINNTFDITLLKEEINKGNCVGAYNSVTDSQAHEMTHYIMNRATGGFPSIGEGIADYTVNDGGKIILTSVNKTNQLVCEENGYFYTVSPEKFYPYEKLSTSGNHQTSNCFLREVRTKYGDEVFKKMFAISSQLNQNGKYCLFKDIVNPAVGNDVYPLFKEKYMLSGDICEG